MSDDVINFGTLFLRVKKEDRLVKRAFRQLSHAGWRTLTRKPLRPTDAEIHSNPRARSARFRVLERGTES